MTRRARAAAAVAKAATITFEARPDAAEAVGDRAAWMQWAADAWPAVSLAAGLLTLDDAGLEAAVRQFTPKFWFDLLDCAEKQRGASVGVSKVLEAAQARLLIALSRRSVAEGAGA